MNNNSLKKWWKESILYQIYPRSFKDSNGDGIGDLKGIIEKIPYLKALGIDLVWLSPVYQSPNDDNGYDISDYYRIMEEFGTMEDFDELLEAMHKAGIRLLMDLVVNHTSDEHLSFQASRLSKDNPYRDHYIWRPPAADGGPPNNWKSFFSGSAWEFDELTGEYFLHLFTKRQPDLNWENPEVRQEVYKLMRFWLDKGVDGFRMDVIPLISKETGLPDKDWSVLQSDFGAAYANGPRVHEFLREMNEEVLSKYDVVTIGEGIGVTADLANDYVGEDRKELHMVFHFGHMFMDHGPEGRYDPKSFKLKDFTDVFDRWENELGDKGWGTLYLGNHDFPRAVSRFGDEGNYREESAKLLATLLMTRKGTPTIYQGDEFGMTNTGFCKKSDYRDVDFFNAFKEIVDKGLMTESEFLKAARTHGRDHARTPVLWENAPHGGFSTATPWIMANESYPEINAESAQKDPNSIFHYYRKLIELRKSDATWVYGETEVLKTKSPQVYVYTRSNEEKSFRVVLNFSSEQQTIQENLLTGKQITSNYPADNQPNNSYLRPWEALIFEI